ncbi:MAG: SgcJ/EcaC family oxidoreductase [Terracidiphilus sp.]
MLNMGVFCLGMLLPAALISESGCEADERAIRGVLDRFMDAWNCHDAKAFALVFSPDADVTNWRGTVVSGRSGVEQMHAPVFATIFRNSHQKYTEIKTRFIRPDVAAVDVNWEMTGATDPVGNPRPARQGLLSFVMAKSKGEWQVVVMHNLDLTALPPIPPMPSAPK